MGLKNEYQLGSVVDIIYFESINVSNTLAKRSYLKQRCHVLQKVQGINYASVWHILVCFAL